MRVLVGGFVSALSRAVGCLSALLMLHRNFYFQVDLFLNLFPLTFSVTSEKPFPNPMHEVLRVSAKRSCVVSRVRCSAPLELTAVCGVRSGANVALCLGKPTFPPRHWLKRLTALFCSCFLTRRSARKALPGGARRLPTLPPRAAPGSCSLAPLPAARLFLLSCDCQQCCNE